VPFGHLLISRPRASARNLTWAIQDLPLDIQVMKRREKQHGGSSEPNAESQSPIRAGKGQECSDLAVRVTPPMFDGLYPVPCFIASLRLWQNTTTG
jgi:hypothetical protein